MSNMKSKTKCYLCGESGGRLRFSEQGWFHVGRCAFRDADRVAPTPVFPFSTSHLDSPDVVASRGPLEINNLRELRRYERQAGVSSDPFSNNSSYQNERY